MPLFLTPIPHDVIKQLDRRAQILGDSGTSTSTFKGLGGLVDKAGTMWGMGRTPFIRAASFAVIRDSFTQEFLDKYKNSEEGTTFAKVVEEVPNGVITHEHKHHHRLRNVLYGGGLKDFSGASLNSKKYSNLLDDFSDYDKGWNGHFQDKLDVYKTRTGNSANDPNSRLGSPQPGITDVTVENVGKLGSLKKIDMNIVCHDFAQLQMIEALYMTPGITVLLEWGWSTDTEGGNVQNTLIDLKRSGTLSDVNLLHTMVFKKASENNYSYEGAIATITNYSWSAESNGTFKCSVSLRSRGEALLGVNIKDSHSNLINSIKKLTTPRNDNKIYEIQQTLKRTNGTSEKAQLGGFDLDADGFVAQRFIENNLSTVSNQAYPALYSKAHTPVGTLQFVGMESNPEGLLPKVFPRFYYAYKTIAADEKRAKLMDRAKVSIAGGEKQSNMQQDEAKRLFKELLDTFVGSLIMPALNQYAMNSGGGEEVKKKHYNGLLKPRDAANRSGNRFQAKDGLRVLDLGWEIAQSSITIPVGDLWMSPTSDAAPIAASAKYHEDSNWYISQISSKDRIKKPWHGGTLAGDGSWMKGYGYTPIKTAAAAVEAFHRPIWEAQGTYDVPKKSHRLLMGSYAPWGKAFPGWGQAISGDYPKDQFGASGATAAGSMIGDFLAWYRHVFSGEGSPGVVSHNYNGAKSFHDMTIPLMRIANQLQVITTVSAGDSGTPYMTEVRKSKNHVKYLNPYGILDALGEALQNGCQGTYPNGYSGGPKNGSDLMGLVGIKGIASFAKSAGVSYSGTDAVKKAIKEFWKGSPASNLMATIPTQWGNNKLSRPALYSGDTGGVNHVGYNTWTGYLFCKYPAVVHHTFATGTNHYNRFAEGYWRGGNDNGAYTTTSGTGARGGWVAPSGGDANPYLNYGTSWSERIGKGVMTDWPMPLVGAYQEAKKGAFRFPEAIKENRKQFEKTVDNRIEAAKRSEKIAFADATAAFKEYRAISEGDVYIPFAVLEQLVNDNIALQNTAGDDVLRFDSGDHVLQGVTSGQKAGSPHIHNFDWDVFATKIKQWNDTTADPNSPYGAGAQGGVTEMQSGIITAAYPEALPESLISSYKFYGLPNANSHTIYFEGFIDPGLQNEGTVPTDMTQLVSLPSKICNHPYLISTDPGVCLLPGQLGVGSTQQTIDGQSVTVFIDSGVADIGKFKKFTDDPDKQYGYLSNILINTEAILKAFDSSTTIKDAFQKTLDAVSRACGNIWNFKFQIDGELDSGSTRIIDANFANSKCERVAEFPVHRMDSIITDYSLQSKIPNAMAVMALYGNNAPFSDGTMRNDLYELGNIFTDLAHENIQFPVNTTENASEDDATFMVPDNNAERINDLQTLSGRIHKYQSEEDFNHASQILTAVLHDRIGSGTDTGYGKNALLDHNIIPLKMSFTLDGISGIHFGYALTATHLPARYRDTICFQVTNVKHSITTSGWKTTVEAIMRRRPQDMSVYTIGTGQERYLGTKGLKNPRHMGNFEIEQEDGSIKEANVVPPSAEYSTITPKEDPE